MDESSCSISAEGRVRSMVNWKETKCGKCKIQRGRQVCNSSFSYDKFIPIAITNADRIRSMSDEELLDFICSIETYDEGSVKTIEGGSALCSVTDVEKWLQSAVEE